MMDGFLDYAEGEAQIDALHWRYMWAVAAALLLGEDAPESPLAEIRALRAKSLPGLVGNAPGYLYHAQRYGR